MIYRGQRHAVVWSESQKCYCCPVCGKPINKEYYEGRGRYKERKFYRLTENDFAKKTALNQVCKNYVLKWNKEAGSYNFETCNAKLWQANSKIHDEENFTGSKWIKFGNEVGWYETRHIEKLLEELNSKLDLRKDDLQKVAEFSAYMRDEIPVQTAPRRYPIAKYIHRFLKGYIDYVIFDEIHLLKAGDSLQGEAFGDLAATAKKVIGLTGTLVNGYASGIYYILFRAFPEMMKKQGYIYGTEGENQFVKNFGVVKKQYSVEWKNGSTGKRVGTAKLKALPGISPLVFTKFLLENTAFLSIEDITSEMPGYKEIPMPVEMDDELKSAYQKLDNDVRENMDFFRNAKFISQMFNLLSIFPDQPYEQPPVLDFEHDRKVIVQPPEISKVDVRNKETKLLELVQEKIAAGEKVLIYYSFVSRTDVTKRLKKILEENNISVAVLSSTVKSREREQWIKDKIESNIDVLICNPSLVETGLDLLDFTTIIFYQCGYNLYTMRQASRRSWRISQSKDVEVYFLYYQGTVQEQIISLMANKLQAALAIEGKFNAEGLNALSNNSDILTQLAANFADKTEQTIDMEIFEKTEIKGNNISKEVEQRLIDTPQNFIRPSIFDKINRRKNKIKISAEINSILNSP